MSCFGAKNDAGDEKVTKIKGKVALMKKNLLDLNDFGASILDRAHELFCHGVGLQLISSVTSDTQNEMRGKVGKEAYLEAWSCRISAVTAETVEFDVTFEWDESIGVPGAFFIKNHHHSEFFLRTLILEDVPGAGSVHFVCNSWVYPVKYYKYTRIFFANQSYVTNNTPEPLRKYREDELKHLRGDGTGELQNWDRVYDYATYNDLGLNRPVIGGSKEFPYPRRVRTGRKPNKKDPNHETRLCIADINIYCPRDEKFSRIKFSDFLAVSIKSLGQVFLPEITGLFDFCHCTPDDFDTFEDVLQIYKGFESGKIDPNSVKSSGGFELIKEFFRTDGESFLKYPKPAVIQADENAWRTDEEFAREMLAGLNPVSVELLQKFPPTSKLDPEVYGNHTSSMTKEHIEKNLNGLTVTEALEQKKLFMVDHNVATIPYLPQINKTSTKCYATRTILLLQEDGTLKPLAIELTLGHPDGQAHGAKNKVITPAHEGVEGSIWRLAKAYVNVNDSSCHQLISHWLYTHAAIEPFIIATNRQLSVLHPIYKLLHPHFRDTMNINGIARELLISEGGYVERVVFPAKYSMEFSSLAYKQWVFTDQALPEELIKRGMAVRDTSKPHGVALTIEDYPYAVDGLEVWSAIEDWVREYCAIYYPTDESVSCDKELQLWWEELRTEGHGDLKDEPWWPKMQTVVELVQSCATIIWIASAFHAAVNFGQYPYAGFHPNRPTMSRRFIPEPGTPEYDELEKNPDAVFLKTINSQFVGLLGMSLVEILSRHSADEIYLGQRENPDIWTKDAAALEAFKKFGERLVEAENRMMERNNDETLKNRNGPVKVPYTLLCPYNSPSYPMGLTGRGIPNSVSI